MTVQEHLQTIKNESFVKGYKATDAEAMGLLISHEFEWDGIQILESAMYALEDANFHKESAEVQVMIDRINTIRQGGAVK